MIDDGRHKYNVAQTFDLTCEEFNQTLREALNIEGQDVAFLTQEVLGV